MSRNAPAGGMGLPPFPHPKPLSRGEKGFTAIQRETTMRHGQSTFGRSTYTPITSGRGRAWTEVFPVARLASRTRR